MINSLEGEVILTKFSIQFFDTTMISPRNILVMLIWFLWIHDLDGHFQNYKFEHDLVKSRLSCPITCFDGDGDVPHDQDSFAQLTTSREFDKIVLPGGHFYLFQDSNRDKILKMISDYFGGWDEIC